MSSEKTNDKINNGESPPSPEVEKELIEKGIVELIDNIEGGKEKLQDVLENSDGVNPDLVEVAKDVIGEEATNEENLTIEQQYEELKRFKEWSEQAEKKAAENPDLKPGEIDYSHERAKEDFDHAYKENKVEGMKLYANQINELRKIRATKIEELKAKFGDEFDHEKSKDIMDYDESIKRKENLLNNLLEKYEANSGETKIIDEIINITNSTEGYKENEAKSDDSEVESKDLDGEAKDIDSGTTETKLEDPENDDVGTEEMINVDGPEILPIDNIENDNDTPEDDSNNPEGNDSNPEQAPDEEKLITVAKLMELAEFKEIKEQLVEAREKYSYETAKERKGYLSRIFKTRGFLGINKKLRKIPGVEKYNQKKSEATLLAKQEYDKAQKELEAKAIEYYKNIEAKEKEVTKALNKQVFLEARRLENNTMEERLIQSKDANKFTNWWHQQKGFKGGIKKALVVMGAGASVGLGLGLIGVGAGITTIAGLVTGLGIGHHATQRRAASVLENGKTVAENDRDQDLAAKRKIIRAEGPEAYVDSDVITKMHEEATDRDVARNRRDMKSAAAAGMAGANLGHSLGSYARSKLTGSSNNTASASSNNSSSTNKSSELKKDVNDNEIGLRDNVESDKINKLNDNINNNIENNNLKIKDRYSGESSDIYNIDKNQLASNKTIDTANNSIPTPKPSNEFFVEPGHGYIHELQDWINGGAVNGKQISVEQAGELHNFLSNKFGADYININSAGNDIYSALDGTRLMEPGNASWAKGVPEAIRDWVTNNVN